MEKSDLQEFQSDYAVLDPANVCGIFPLIKRNNYDEVKELDTKMGFFKKDENMKITMPLSESFEGEVIKLNNTKFSKEYIDNMKQMASAWFSECPEILLMYDKEKKEFIKNSPALFVFGSVLCFILAPRVEEGDE